MKCPKCGYENRPEARFCKRCGQPLVAAPPPAPPAAPSAPPAAEVTCPQCGMLSKAGARFCANCGAPLTPPGAAAVPPFPGAAAPPSYPPPPSQPAGPAYYPPTPPSYGPPYPPSPPPPEPEAPEPEVPPSRFPRWVWFVLIGLLVLCIIAAGVVGFLFVTKKGPFAQPEPTPTVTESPTPEESPPPPSPESAQPAVVAVGMELPTTELKVGDSLTVTVTVNNTGDRPFSEVEYRLLGEWEPALTLQGDRAITQAEELAPSNRRTVTFSFQASQEGTAYIQVLIVAKVSGPPPRWEVGQTEVKEIHVAK